MSAEEIRAAMRAAEDEGDAAAAAAVEKEAAAEMDEFTKVRGCWVGVPLPSACQQHCGPWALLLPLSNTAGQAPCCCRSHNNFNPLTLELQEPLALPSEAGEAGDDTTTRDSAGGAVADAGAAGGAATSRERTPGAAVGGAAAAAEAVAAAEEDDMMKDMAALAGELRMG